MKFFYLFYDTIFYVNSKQHYTWNNANESMQKYGCYHVAINLKYLNLNFNNSRLDALLLETHQKLSRIQIYNLICSLW